MNPHAHNLAPTLSEPAPSNPPALERAAVLAYGVVAYAFGVAALLAWILAMLGVLPFAGGPLALTGVAAGVFNLALMVAFGLQHSLMARRSFKSRLTRVVPPAAERATYVLATGLVLGAVVWLWQPMPAVIWTVQSSALSAALTGLALLAWAYLFLATFAISHFELLGLRQVWQFATHQTVTPVPFRERWMYRFDRHPIMTGALLGMWLAPHMQLDHLLFAAFATLYIVIGVHFEERSLERRWGVTYLAYRKRARSIVPTFSGRRATVEPEDS